MIVEHQFCCSFPPKVDGHPEVKFNLWDESRN